MTVFSQREYCVTKTTGSVRFVFDSFRDATPDKLDASWPTFARSRRAGERVSVRARWRDPGMDRIFHRGKTRAERKGYAPPRRFWGAEVERPVKNVIKMCLELPGGKDVMNIKRALEAPDAAIYISIYAQVRKQPRTCCREIDSPQKQADSFKRVERSHSRWWPFLPKLFISLIIIMVLIFVKFSAIPINH